MQVLQAEVTHAARLVLLLTAPVVAVLVLFGGHVLSLFGPTFKTAWLPLVILVVPQLINAATGTAGYLLVMTRFERQAAALFGISALANVSLNLALIPDWVRQVPQLLPVLHC